ncbi:hypothetical protein YC2023_046165 [Brassica napus]
MPGLTCNACNMLFENESFITAPIGTVTISSARSIFFVDFIIRSSENSTLTEAEAPGVTEELFEARKSALAMEKGKSDERLMLYTCRVCGKGYRNSKAHEQHCKSWSHVLRVSQGTTSNGDEDVVIVTPLPRRFKNKDNEESDNE